MSKNDQTFHSESLSGSTSWVALRLGRSVDWFRKHREVLEQEGFPRPDPIIGHYIKADVDAWIASRTRAQQIANMDLQPTGGFNSDAL